MLRRLVTYVCATLGLLILWSANTQAQETTLPIYEFGRYSEGYYVGGTSGLAGVDSIRGVVDSIFYHKWVENSDRRLMDPLSTVIYGDDDRVDIYTLTDPNYLRLAAAACVIVNPGEVANNGDGTYTLSGTPWTSSSGYPLCEGERFAGQLRLGSCSAFLVGEDLVVTAGHCVSTCNGQYFIFDYQQTDSLTPPAQVIPEDNVYQCVEIVDHALFDDYDHCLVRLDRPVVGRDPLPIRRSGSVQYDDPLVLVGHPKGLPMKLAAGASVKDEQSAMPWFQANTDSYSGNSGSMVVNTDTWRVEGILVRGAPDFVYNGSCVYSNQVPNTGNTGSGLMFEEISKIDILAGEIPDLVVSKGNLELNKSTFTCSDQIDVTLRDIDLANSGPYDLLVVTPSADSELVTVTEAVSGDGVFYGSLTTSSGALTKYDGLLEGSHGEQFTVIYEDADNGTGNPGTVNASGSFDCQAPIISQVSIVDYGPARVVVAFETDEYATGQVYVGQTCGDAISSAVGAPGTDHEITVLSLEESTPYYVWVTAADAAGNAATDDNSGACYPFVTAEQLDFLTESFVTGCDLQGLRLVLEPNPTENTYDACLYPAASLPGPTGGPSANLDDDDYGYVELTDGETISFFGVDYPGVYIGSNGYVTFSEGDHDWSPSPEEHLAWPPRLSAFWSDLDPTAGGRLSYEQLVDRFLVTWHSIPGAATTNSATCQAQFFFNGMIDITWTNVTLNSGLVGLSDGSGYSIDYLPSDVSEYAGCNYITCYIDADDDGYGDPEDFGHFEVGPSCEEFASANQDDCDETSNLIYPGAPETDDDQIDQDCDGYDATCCVGIVGDVNGDGTTEPTIGDISKLIDHLFGSQLPLGCLTEADANQSGGRYPTETDITIGDISTLIDHLFINEQPLLPCLTE